MGLCRGQGCSSGEFQGNYTSRTLYTQGRCVILSQPQEKRAHACMGAHMMGVGCVRVRVWECVVWVLERGRESACAHNTGYVHVHTHECGGQRTLWPLFSATVRLICESSLSLSQSSPRRPGRQAAIRRRSSCLCLPNPGITSKYHWITFEKPIITI